MAIEKWWWGLGSVYLWDTLIAGWGWWGGWPSRVAIPVPWKQLCGITNCCFTSGNIWYVCCCWFEYFLWSTCYKGWCSWKIINTWCTVIVPTSNYRNFNWVSDDWIWCKQSKTYYIWYTRDWTRCSCSGTPQWYTDITLDYNVYCRVQTRPACWSQNYDYIDIVIWCKK